MGALTLRDPRVTFEDNKIFLDMVENYFQQPEEEKMKDARPDIAYQIGVTPEGIETPKCVVDPECITKINSMEGENKPHLPVAADVKWRFFHKLGERPPVTNFPFLDHDPILPAAFPDWRAKMDNWGLKLLQAGETLAEMAAIGFGLPAKTLVNLMKYAPHLLAPTASDLGKYGNKEQILAGYHQDLNFMTIHGKSRFPGLYIWLRNGQKLPVSIPDGCLLAQAGMQFEYLTGGKVMAGYHEVVVNDATLQAIENAKAENRCLWRISSTVFTHIASDNILKSVFEPVPPEIEAKFPPIAAGKQVENELKRIKLLKQ
uniref:Isopenicillin N synthase-like Fe(2+) 2OG dioxygenase domain-containing protein n=1 Tax=Arcella intermedia TaxID=1963864 RepID=A0A6B2L8P8_9EUKA